MRSNDPLLAFTSDQRWQVFAMSGLILVVWGVVSIHAVVADSTGRDAAWVGVGIFGLAAFVLVDLVQMWARPITVTASEIRVPSWLRDRCYPIADVSGVGMTRIRAGRASGWRTTVWLADGRRAQITRYLRGGRRHPDPGGARNTRAMWERISEVQGPDGPLLTQARQRSEDSRWQQAGLVWCPDDGTMYDPRERPADR